MTAHDFKPRLRNQITEVLDCITRAKDVESRNRLNYYLRKMEEMQQTPGENPITYNIRLNRMEYPEAIKEIRYYCLQFYENLRKI
jgi:hypothetical protein